MADGHATRRALVTGISGQDGAYLSKLLLENGYEVFGGHRRSATQNLWRLDELGITDKINIIDFELTEYSNILNAVRDVAPTEIYNLASQSNVAVSFKQPIFTGDVNGVGVTRILDVIRSVDPSIRFYQASTSEMFGMLQGPVQSEKTPFQPSSPYAAAKVYGHWTVVNYRNSYDIFAVSGILFNHESPLRGVDFVTRKITSGLAMIRAGQANCITLGNLNAVRDWGHAADYVHGMWLMLQQDTADDYVLATGEPHTVREFVDLAAQYAGFTLEWSGEGLEERAFDKKSGETVIKIDKKFYRPTEVNALAGDASKAKEKLNWRCEHNFEQLVSEMVRADIDLLDRRGRIF